jgi:NAD(P)-dependent dehydrogenase (short-subunit alcohol dehydrogenase family)
VGERPIAFVTGASRGIGKGIALALAGAGFDVALTARTVAEGDPLEHSSTVRRSDTRPLPGSLASTAELVEQQGVRSMVVAADLLDRASVVAAAATVLDAWGAVDVLVNNGRYVGPGHMDLFEDTPLELLDRHLEANVMAPLALTKALLPSMLARGSGTIVNITSGAGYADPPAAAGSGGWGLGYGISKGAMHRIAGVLALELGSRGIHVYNVQPGFIATERMVQDMAEFGFDASTGAPPAVVGAVVAWLVTDPSAAEPNGRNIEAQDVCRELKLLPGWPA